jgi:serine kinase of HPr protein (carbohydrate metabolism regulator)
MADIHVIIFARNKKVTEEMIHLATQHNMMLIETPYSIFRISGILYKHGIKPIY